MVLQCREGLYVKVRDTLQNIQKSIIEKNFRRISVVLLMERGSKVYNEKKTITESPGKAASALV